MSQIIINQLSIEKHLIKLKKFVKKIIGDYNECGVYDNSIVKFVLNLENDYLINDKNFLSLEIDEGSNYGR